MCVHVLPVIAEKVEDVPMKNTSRDRAIYLGILSVLLLAATSQVTLGQDRSKKTAVRSDRSVRQAAATKESEPARKKPQS